MDFLSYVLWHLYTFNIVFSVFQSGLSVFCFFLLTGAPNLRSDKVGGQSLVFLHLTFVGQTDRAMEFVQTEQRPGSVPG